MHKNIMSLKEQLDIGGKKNLYIKKLNYRQKITLHSGREADYIDIEHKKKLILK